MKSYKRINLILGIAVSLTLISPFVFASDDEINRKSLKGIKTLSVLIESLDPEIERDGLTKEQIKTDVELKLRLAGIKIDPDTLYPWLYVNLTIYKTTNQYYVYFINVEVLQYVTLTRFYDISQNNQKLNATTWTTGYLGITRNFEDIRNKIKDRIDEFLNAYLSVNPK